MAVSSKKTHKVKPKAKYRPSVYVTKKRRGGGSLIQSPVVFSSNSEYVYVNSGWGVKVFSVKTGECVKELETSLEGHGRVVSVMMVDGSPVIATVDASKRICLLSWHPESSSVKNKLEVELPNGYEEFVCVDCLLVPNGKDSSRQDLCVVLGKQVDVYQVLFYDPRTAHYLAHPLNGTYVGYCVGKQLLSFGGPPDARMMATVARGVGLCVYSLDGSKHKIGLLGGGGGGGSGCPEEGRNWTSVCCHPTEPRVAAGDATGRCVLFSNPVLHPKVRTVFHWHTLPCDVIAFTPAGSTMYTGGGEHVLVKWNVENPNVRNFLPRLSAPLVHISVAPDNSLVAVSTLDNGVILVENSHKVSRVLQQLSWGVIDSNQAAHPFPAGLTFDRLSCSVVLNSRPGHLQFFCPDTETLTSVDICQRNYLTQERNKVITNTDVSLVALSWDSAWMATVETRQESDSSLELRLKLWEYQQSPNRWTLNSVVDMPHSRPVVCLKFQPASISTSVNSSPRYLLVTTGKDAKFRLWSPSPIDSIYKKGMVWKCEGTSCYKDREAGPACFSQDGSLLAVAFEHILTLWSSQGITFKTSLSRFPPCIRQVEFGRESCSHLVVATTDTRVTVWNLLTLTVHWTARVRPSILIANPLSSYMAVVSNVNKHLYVFNPLNPEVVHKETELCDSNAKVLGATFAPTDLDHKKAPLWLIKSVIYYLDSNQELKSIEWAEDTIGSRAVDVSRDKEEGTLFSKLKQVRSVSDVKTNQDDHSGRHRYGLVAAAAVNQLLRAPCHTMAPMSSMCNSLLEAFAMSKKVGGVKERAGEDDQDDDDDDEGWASSDMEDKESGVASMSGLKSSSTASTRSPGDSLFFIDLDLDHQMEHSAL